MEGRESLFDSMLYINELAIVVVPHGPIPVYAKNK